MMVFLQQVILSSTLHLCIVYCVYDSCYKIMILLELVGTSLAVSQLLVFITCFREVSHEASVSEIRITYVVQVLLYQ
jgi:hypothetical protein